MYQTKRRTRRRRVYRETEDQYLPGGYGDDLNIEDVDVFELALGIYIELEHVGLDEEMSNEDKLLTAMEIALDHLAESLDEGGDYYSKLVEMEDGISLPSEIRQAYDGN